MGLAFRHYKSVTSITVFFVGLFTGSHSYKYWLYFIFYQGRILVGIKYSEYVNRSVALDNSKKDEIWKPAN